VEGQAVGAATPGIVSGDREAPNPGPFQDGYLVWGNDRFAYGSWSRAEAGQPLRP